MGFPGRPQLLEKSDLALSPVHPYSKGGGVVVVEAIIGTSGNIVKARVAAGPQDSELHAKLVQCLRSWKFTPAMHEGEAWAVSWHLTFNIYPVKS